MSVSDLEDTANKIREAWKKFFHALKNRIEQEELDYEFDQALPSQTYSMTELDGQIEGLITLVLTADFASPIARPILANIEAQLTTIEQAIASLVDSAAATGKLDVKSFVIAGQQGSVNLGQQINTVESHSSKFLSSYLAPLLALQSETGARFVNATQAFVDEYNSLKNKSGVITKHYNQSSTRISEIRELQKKCGELVSKVDKAHADVIETVKSAETERDSVILLKNEIDSFHTETEAMKAGAEKLAGQVNEYSDKFKTFQEDMDKRFSDADELQKALSALIEKQTGQQATIDKLNKDAEAMLSGATTAGLAGEFSSYRDSLARSVLWASFAFYASILLLGLFSLPLTIMVVPSIGVLLEWALSLPEGLLSNFAQAVGRSNTELFLEGLARVLLVLPFVWLATFTARRHGRLFRLKEHYAYKRSIAASVDGFKLQAPEYKNEIAAAAFHELAYNPAERMDKEGEDSKIPNPVWNWLIKRIEKQTGD